MARICVFCGAHTGFDSRYADVAAATGRSIAQAGFGLVYGGGRVGLMGALADGALAAGGEVIGVIPHSLATEEVAHKGIARLHLVDSMHERKALMADLSDAFLALPGAFGTMDEFCEIVTWRQLRIHHKPIALLNVDGFYDDLLRFFDRVLERGFMQPPTRDLFASATSVGAAIAYLCEAVEGA